MDRFPMLNTYRGLLLIAAVLLLIGGFLAAIGAADSDFGDGFNIGIFIGIFGPAAIAALFLLYIAELTQLGLSIEDHLYHIRYYQEQQAARGTISTTEPAKSYVPGSGFSQRTTTESGSTMAPAVSTPAAQERTLSSSQPSRLFGFNSSVPAAPPSPRTSSEEVALEFFNQARHAQSQNEFEKAITLYGRAIARDPKGNPGAYYYRAECHYQLGRNKQADDDMAIYNQLAAEHNPPSNTDM